MPVVAVGAAVVGGMSIAAGVTGFALVAAVGAVIGGVGAVTGNKALSQIGGVMGLVGGVGALATNAGLIGTVDAVPGGDLVGNQGTGQVTDGGSGTASVAQATNDVGAPSITQVDAVPGGDLVGAQGTPGLATPPSAPVTVEQQTALADVAIDGVKGGNQGPNGPANNGLINAGAENVYTGPQTASSAGTTGTGGIFDYIKNAGKSLLTAAEKNPTMAFGVMNTLGKFVEGAFNPLTTSQKNLLDAQAASQGAQAANQQANAALTAQQQANIGQKVPVATGGGGVPGGVFPAGAAPSYGQVNINRGLINGRAA